MKAILIFTASLFVILLSSVVAGESESGGNGGGGRSSSSSIEWQIITKQNYSSQIRLHPHLLLLITEPWSGESRSLMKDLAFAVTRKQEKFGPLKLRVLYKSNERMLADALGAREGLTFLYYHHSLSYKYQGRLRTQNILSSIYSQMSLSPEELPFRPLNTPEALKAFLESTDKAIILLEFCGWTPRLLAKGKNNVTENAFDVQDSAIASNKKEQFFFATVPQATVFALQYPSYRGLFGTDSDGEINSSLISREKKDQKGSSFVPCSQKQGRKKESFSCAVESKVSGISFLRELFSVNESTPFLETENTRPGVGLSCTFEEFQQFDSFFMKFIAVTREFFLPPERQRYGLVSEKSLLSFLGVKDSGPWFAMLNFAGCPGCSKVFKGVDDLKFVLQMHNPFVSELEDDDHDLEPALPGNKPSVLLFVDRSSESSATRQESKEALDAFRHLALNYQVSHHLGGKNNDQPRKFSAQAAARSTSRHPKLELSPTSQKIQVKDKMSIMIIKEGKHAILDSIASNSQGSSLHEILAYFRQQKKEATLSSLAKELGFQLLSDDLDIKIEDSLPSNAFQSNQLSPELPLEGIVKSGDELGKDQSYMETISEVEPGKISKTIEKTGSVGKDAKSMSVEPDIYPASNEVATADDEMNEKKGHIMVGKGQEQLHVEGFKGSFFFSDGGYQLLKALTAGSKIPSMVIVDPISMQHFVYPEHGVFSNLSLSDFLDEFSNGSLIPYQRSGSVLVSPKEAMRPPFVNLGFREVDSIPPVTALSLSNLVLGLNQSGTQNSGQACEKDVLVLFSNRWCGFCQRMELVVREVYRALIGYKMLKGEQRNVKLEFSSVTCVADNLNDDMLKLPLIYLMDCTLNECSSILKSMGQREVYPALMLFPAERKHALSYEGNMVVTDVIKFIANHGSHSHHLIAEKGIIWTEVEKEDKSQNLFKNESADAVHVEGPVAMDNHHEVLLKNRALKRTVKYNQIRSHTSNDMHETAPHVVAGSILVATEKLLNAPSFDKSTILIVNADHNSGFQGLIINKLISWDSLQNLEEELELLKQAPLSFGGPVIKHGLPLVALVRRVIKNEYPEVLPGFYFLDQFATVHEIEGLRLGNQSVTDYWFFLGYSSWRWEQLFDEIAEGAWKITDNNMVQLDWPH